MGSLPKTNFMTKEELFNQLKSILVESFMVEEDDVTLEANLFSDLDFDSIDVIDLAAKVHAVTGQNLNPEQFREVHTIGDIIDVVIKIQAEG